ncbi:MAG: hypothetical protein H7Z43_13650 [Clostridia bacterium]|nr:hypothetical protein [Deltaproteobacteria bacterium]
MSPEQRGVAAVLSRLLRELEHDRAALEAHALEAETLVSDAPKLATPGDRARAAIALHAWYTGLETLLERFLRQLDGDVPTGETSHRDILFQATAVLPHVRPAILPSELTRDLLELLSFRHFFRHSYAIKLDPDRLCIQLETLLRVRGPTMRALADAETFLREALGVATSDV